MPTVSAVRGSMLMARVLGVPLAVIVIVITVVVMRVMMLVRWHDWLPLYRKIHLKIYLDIAEVKRIRFPP
jgi:uncharacterized membrane protein YedE/YeeE